MLHSLRRCLAGWMVLATLPVAFIVSACGQEESGPGVEGAALDAAALEAQATLVRTTSLVRGTYERRVYVVHGVTQPYKQFRVGFERAGLVEQVTVEQGERVEPGQRLAKLDTQSLALQRSEAELHLEQAEADWQRVREAKESFTAAQIEEAQRTLEQARVALEQVELALERSVCHAPHEIRDTAVIEHRHVEPGEVVAAGQPLMTLVDTTSLRLTVRLPGRIVSELKVGESIAEVRLRDAGAEQERLRIPITRIATVADAARQFELELEVPNEAGRLRAGMVAEVTLEMPPRENVTVLPMSAVTRQGEGYIAWLAQPTAPAGESNLARLAESPAAPGTATGLYRAKKWRFPVEDTELWHNDLITPHAPPHGILITEGYQSLLEGQPVRQESTEHGD